MSSLQSCFFIATDVPVWISRFLQSPLTPLGFSLSLGLFRVGKAGTHSALISVDECAPNTCIGGSGTRATHRPDRTAMLSASTKTRQEANFLYLFLARVSALIVPLANSLLLLLGIALPWTLLVSLRLRSLRLCRMANTLFRSWPQALLASLGRAASTDPILTWTPNHPRKRDKPKRRAIFRSLCSLAFGFSTAPNWLPMNAVAFSTWFIHPTAAMARNETPEDIGVDPPAVRPPHLLSPDELTSHVGVCDAGPDPEAPPTGSEAYWSVSRLEEARTAGYDNDDDGWVGVTVYTPHYRTVSLAVHAGRDSSHQRVLDLVTESNFGVPPGFFDTVVPLRPQTHLGYASLIRFSSSTHKLGGGEGMVAVIADLSRVGGPYFATILPRSLSTDDLRNYLRPLAHQQAGTLRFFIGCRTRPWPDCAFIQLQDGDVIIGTYDDCPDIARHRFVDLFQEKGRFGSLHLMPIPQVRESVCVLYKDQRFCFPNHHHQDMTVVQYVLSQLHLNPNDVQMCSFPISDLEVQGDLCTFLVAVQEVPRPATWEVQQIQVRHTFVLLDFRPLGLKPRFVHTNFPALHIPSLASRYEIVLSPARRLGVFGGRRVRDDVYVDNNCTLVFFADDADNAPVYSDSENEPVPSPPSPAPSMPQSSLQDANSHQQMLDTTHQNGAWGDDWTAAQNPTNTWEDSIDLTADTAVSFNDWVPTGPPPWETAGSETPVESVWEDEWCNHATVHSTVVSPPGISSEAPLHQQTSAVDISGGNVPGAAMQQCHTSIQVFVAVPDYIPELYTISLDMPCSVDTMLSFVRRARNARNWGTPTCFGNVVPVCPQLSPLYLVLVGSPTWMQDQVPALFDCRSIDSRAFVAVVDTQLSRESLLTAAGYQATSGYRVFVHGLSQPLAIAQVISLYPGIMVSFTDADQGPPEAFDLATMLQSPLGWDSGAMLPSPRWCRGSHYWVLTDDGPILFAVYNESRLRSELAAILQAEDNRLVIRPSAPALKDLLFRGQPVSGLVVATQAMPQRPPGATGRDRQIILILDQRPILRGIQWRILARPTIQVQALADEFSEFCPHGYSVVFRGADVLRIAGQTSLVLGNGQVVSVEFVPDNSALPSTSSPPPNDDPWEDDDDSTDRPPDEDDDRLWHQCHNVQHAASDFSGANAPGAAEQTGNRPRSRSPRQRGVDSFLPPPFLPTEAALSCVSEQGAPLADRICNPRNFKGMWSSVITQGALDEGRRCFTSATAWVTGPYVSLLNPDLGHLSACITPTFGMSPVMYRMLPGHGAPDAPTGTAFNAPRQITRQLGFNWPFEPETPIDLTQTEDEIEPVEATELSGELAHIVFVLLAPEYRPEYVPVDLVIPQEVDEALEVVDTCRQKAMADTFPVLIPAHPQPDVRWAVLLLQPIWLHSQIVICIDTTLVDERLFAVATSPDSDKHSLLNLAGFAGGAAIDVYLPGSTEPLGFNDEVRLDSGDCVTFVRAGEPREYAANLRDMLQTHLGWALGPAFPRRNEDDRVCAVHDGRYCDVLIRQGQVSLLRPDIAARFDIPPLRLAMCPASNRPGDVMFCGRSCCTVIGIGTSWRREPDNDLPLALLDCRPILEGWRTALISDGWIDLRSIRNSLMQGAPEGYSIVFSGCRSHWDWRLAEPGEVIRVSLEMSPDDVLQNRVSDDRHNSANDDDPSGDSSRTVVCWPFFENGHDRTDRHPSTSAHSPEAEEGNRRQDMWTSGILHGALAVGTLWYTSVILLVTLCSAIGDLPLCCSLQAPWCSPPRTNNDICVCMACIDWFRHCHAGWSPDAEGFFRPSRHYCGRSERTCAPHSNALSWCNRDT